MEHGPDFHTVGRRYSSKILDRARTFVGKSCVVVLARIRSPRHWMQYKNIKKENCFENSYILQGLDVQQHCCENFIQVGSQGIGQCGPASS